MAAMLSSQSSCSGTADSSCMCIFLVFDVSASSLTCLPEGQNSKKFRIGILLPSKVWTSSLLSYFIYLWMACVWPACWDHCFSEVRRVEKETSLSNLKLATLRLSFMHTHCEFSPNHPGYFKNCYNYLPALFHICIHSAFVFLQNVWMLTGEKVSGDEEKCVICFLIHRWAAQLRVGLSYIALQGRPCQVIYLANVHFSFTMNEKDNGASHCDGGYWERTREVRSLTATELSPCNLALF